MEKFGKLGKLLKKYREHCGLTQLELASKLGYRSSQFVSNWERGVSTPPLKTLKQISKIFNIPANDLLDTLIEITITETEKQMRQEFEKTKVGS